MASQAIALSDSDFEPGAVTQPALTDADFAPHEIALSDADFSPHEINPPSVSNDLESFLSSTPEKRDDLSNFLVGTSSPEIPASELGFASRAKVEKSRANDFRIPSLTQAAFTPQEIVPKMSAEDAGKWARVVDPSGVFALLPKEASNRIAGIGENIIADTANFFTSPAGIATLGIGALPNLAQKAIATAFAGNALKEAPSTIQAIVDAKTPEERDAAIVAATENAMVLGGTAAHILKGSRAAAGTRPSSLSPEEANRAATQNQITALERGTTPAGDLLPERIPQKDSQPITPEMLDDLHLAREKNLDQFSSFGLEEQNARQARIDEIDRQLMEADKDAVDASALRVAQRDTAPTAPEVPSESAPTSPPADIVTEPVIEQPSSASAVVPQESLPVNGGDTPTTSPVSADVAAKTFFKHQKAAIEAARSAGAIDPERAAGDALVSLTDSAVAGKVDLSNPEALMVEASRNAARNQLKAEGALKRGGGKVESSDAPVGESGKTIGEAVADSGNTPDVQAGLNDIQRIADEEVGKLSERDAKIVKGYQDKRPYRDVAKEAGVSPETARTVMNNYRKSVEDRLGMDEPTPEHIASVNAARKSPAKKGLVKGLADAAREDIRKLGPGAANAEEFAKLREETSREHAAIGASHLMEGKTGKLEWLEAMKQEYGMSDATPKELNKIWRDAHDFVESFESAQVGKEIRPKAQIEKTSMGKIERTLADSVSKAKALAGYLSGMEKGSKLGAAARQEQIRMADKWMAADYSQMRKELLDYAQQLPLKERGKLIPAITEALKRIPVLSKNAPELILKRAEDVMNRITAAVYDVNRNEAVSRIEKILSNNEKSQNITIPEKQAIRQRGVTFNALKDKMSLDMLQAMEERMLEIRRAGKDLFIFDKVVQAENVKAIMRDIEAQGVRKIDKPEQARVALGETQSAFDRRLAQIRRAPELLKHFNLAVTPFDWIVQTFDQATGGALRQNMKLPVDVRYQEWLDSVDVHKNALTDIAKKHKLTPGNFDRIGVNAELRQEGGRANLEQLGFTKKELDAAQTLTKGELEWLRKADGINNEIFLQVKQVLENFFHQEIEKVPGYFPRQRDWDYYDTLSIQEGKFARAHNRTNTEKGFTISREGAVTKNLVNAQDIMFKHIDDAMYHVKLGPQIRQLADVVKTEGFKDSVGTWGQKVFSDWVDVLSRNGGSGAGRKIGALDMIRKNVGMAQLAYRITTTALQPLSIIHGMSIVSPKNMGKALNMVVSAENRKWVLDNMPEVKHRVGDDPAYSQYQGSSLRDSWARAGFHMISMLDRFAALTTGMGAYMDALPKGEVFDLNKVNKEAIQAAQLAVRKTQSSSYPKDLPLALSRGNFTGNVSVDRAIFQFQNFLINKWALTKNGALQMGLKEKSPATGARIATFIILGTIMEQLGREGIKRSIQAVLGTTPQQESEKKDEKNLALKIAEKTAVDLVMSVPIVSNIAGVAQFGGSGIPILDVSKNLVTGTAKAISAKNTSTRLAGIVRAAQAASALLGVPSGQIGDLAVQAINANKEKIDVKKGSKKPESLGSKL